jgi:hypothetical protein
MTNLKHLRHESQATVSIYVKLAAARHQELRLLCIKSRKTIPEVIETAIAACYAQAAAEQKSESA